jgi:D-alanyl-D-alanine carboxypeptidase/D-alanyl-D-alanine-endopeptidase (penicillin-binding protein 4)
MRRLRARGAHICFVGALLAAASGPARTDAELGPLAAVAARQRIPARAVSALVQEVGAARPLLAINPLVPRNPASTVKLVTTFVALDLLGPNYSWTTEIHALGPVRDGVLQGDLLLKGHGDPYLIEENLWKMLGALRRTGLSHVTGDLVIDGSHFAPPARNPGDFDGQAYRLYNVLPHAMQVNFKAVTLVFAPAADGRRVQVHTDPELPNLRIDNRLTLARGRCRGLLSTVRMAVPDPIRADRVVLSGSYQTGCGVQTLPRSLLTPEDYAWGLFKRLWAQWGGRLDGGARTAAAPATGSLLLKWPSPPLAEIIRPLNKWSNNVMADALFYTLGGTLFAPPLKPEYASTVVAGWFRRHGLPAEGLVLENGSGLSRRTRISALSLHDLLQTAWQSRYMPEFLASLSIVGVDGTLRRHLRKVSETGWMHLKTGRLHNVAAVAGYVRSRHGRNLVVVLLLNDHGTGEQVMIDTLLRWAWQQ